MFYKRVRKVGILKMNFREIREANKLIDEIKKFG